MQKHGADYGVPAYMFVEFDDLFLYFPIIGIPNTRMVKRRHENREEECVCILNKDFIPVIDLKL
jgi:hypothetical protein